MNYIRFNIWILLISTLISCTIKTDFKKNTSEIQSLKNEAYGFLSLDDSINFLNSNKKYLSQSIKLNDSSLIADAYWNFAIYYNKNKINDSAYIYYSKSLPYYIKVNNYKNVAKQLYDIAILKSRVRDYTGAEKSLYESLSYTDSKNYKQKLYVKNLLGNIYRKLNDTNESIIQFQEALDLISKIDNKDQWLLTINNNLGLLYQDQKDYEKSLKYFNDALQNIRLEDEENYARIKNNIYYTEFLKGNLSNEVENGLLSALNSRIKFNNRSGISDSYIRLSEYYIKIKNYDLALNYAQKALEISKEIKFFEDMLKSYSLLSKLDESNSNKYFIANNNLRDSLENVDRAIRNKFTRIQYETDQYKEQSERLEASNNYLKIIMSLTTLLFVLVFLFFKQRSKNKQISLEREIENEKAELYKLSVESKTKLEEAKEEERRRISMELHDGVLSSIASIRISFGLIAKELFGKGVVIDDFNEYDSAIDHIQKEIRSLSHSLSNTHDSNLNFINLLKNSIVSIDNVKVYIKNNDEIQWDEVSETIKSHLYRIIQESFKNTLKHAQATRFEVIFSYLENQLTLEIKDNGKGIDSEIKSKGIGLSNIKRRVVNILKGKLSIESNSQGTHIKIIIAPLYEKYECTDC